ncbi:MAG: GxxExxY protein [Planctomycetota bacterium]
MHRTPPRIPYPHEKQRAEEDAAVKKLCDLVRQTAYDIRRYLQQGHLEKIYHNALLNRLQKQGIEIQEQAPLTVFDEDGTVLGEYFADLLVARDLIVELKACDTLSPAHEAQLLGYLRAARMRHGLLINFGAPKFQIRKYVL